MKIVECVPNFSEGRNRDVIDAIVAAMAGVKGVTLLDVDPGAATNRTVVTLIGAPDAIVEGAFQGIAKAGQLIDMAVQHGEHPRMGATDVCPFVPVSGVTMEECAELARRLGRRVGEELGIPVYLYEFAATKPEWRSLAAIRVGEYEALEEKLAKPEWKPDFGPAKFNAKSGATVIGARPFLIAYNIDLNTKNKLKANSIAFSLREAGRVKKVNGKPVKDERGEVVREPGLFKECRAVGWYIDEYKRAQISINLTNYHVTSLHDVFDAATDLAAKKGVRVTGSEIVGLVPLEPILMAGKHYLKKQKMSTAVSERDLIEVAVQSLGLNDVAPFKPEEKIIEYAAGLKEGNLVAMSLRDFADELASDSPAPGGGSVAALMASLASALTAMVSNLTFGKKGFKEHNALMEEVGIKGQELKDAFLLDIDRDTEAFNTLMEAMRMPKKSEEEIAERDRALMEATKGAIAIPLGVLQRIESILPLVENVAEKGNPNALSDAGTAAAAAKAGATGALFNVLINLEGFEDKSYADRTRTDALAVFDRIETNASTILKKIQERLKG